ncbi:hypothetical protein P5P86_04240 [Nocardioides sp. BP30]|uniref:hypothetical protein n=1 Tax=Nocardioides sp. BP30 TaxID=3036374 RepID=UPI0024693FB1|nr:hypothetical protein [Nocardioides sp. BP30]WGL53037.1 hypothetical protein P5P86_04240 [Nocardioides sp. BP30]
MSISLKLAATAAAAVTAVGFSATAAHAATTYTPTGSSVNFVGSSVSFTDPTAGQTLTCSTFNLSGSITSSGTSRAYGAAAGSLGTLTSSGCTNPIVGSTTVTPVGTWTVAITGDATGTVWPAELDSVTANVVAAGCSFTAGGGAVKGTFDTSTQKFTPTSSTLTITNTPSGFLCPVVGVAKGHPITVGGSWTNSGTAVSIANP